LNRFAVQMLVQSPDFAIYIYSSDAFTRLPEKSKEIVQKLLRNPL